MRALLILLVSLFVLTACGTRGPLTLPPQAGFSDHSSPAGGHS